MTSNDSSTPRGHPDYLVAVVLVDPRGAYCMDHFVAEQFGPRGGPRPMGNVGVPRSSFEVYKRRGFPTFIPLGPRPVGGLQA